MGVILIENEEIEYVIGKNAAENTRLVKESKGDFWWFHYSNTAGPHLVLKTSVLPPKKILKQIAQVLRSASSKSGGNCPVMYTQIKNVTPTRIPGLVKTREHKTI